MEPLTQLQDLVARGKQRRPDLARRVERAAFIVLFRQIKRLDTQSWLVESEKTPGRFYRVGHQCECRDSAGAPGGLCKHRLAIRMVETLGRTSAMGRARPVRLAPADDQTETDCRTTAMDTRYGPGTSRGTRPRRGLQLETVTGIVCATNLNGIKVGRRWFNFSRFVDVPRPSLGQRVRLEASRGFIRLLELERSVSAARRT